MMKNIEIYKKQYMQMQTDLINAFKKGISTLTMLNTAGELITVNNTFVHTMKSVDVTQSRLIHYQCFLKETLTKKEHRTLQNDKAVSSLMTELNAVKASFDAVSKVIMQITEKVGETE